MIGARLGKWLIDKKLGSGGMGDVFLAHELSNDPAETLHGERLAAVKVLAPELAEGKPASKRSDLYSFGVVLYALLTGRPPFRAESVAEMLHKHRYGQFDRPMQRVVGLPFEIDETVCLLLEKDPAKRPGD